MNLRQMECFLAVADELHFRRAADRLHLAPASVSEAVAGLERSLGARLVERTSRRVRLTPLGADFAAAIRPPIQALHDAHRTARLRSASHRDLAVAHTPELGTLLLPRLVGASIGGADDGADAGGARRWRPVPMHTPRQLVAVADGEVHLGLCWSVPDQPGIVSVVLGEFPWAAVLQASDPLASSAAVALADLRSRRILVTPRSDNPYLDSQLQADLTRAGIRRTDVEEVGRYDELVMHVATRGHVGLHPSPIALTSTLPTVVFRPVADASDDVRICVISREEARATAIGALVVELQAIVGSLDVHTKLR